MTTERGPIRLILINSGVYDYAEIELDRPVHLVGPNNSGKTTLISALQFLYIDHFGEMSFSHSSRETKKYYLPTPQSFVLFECLAPTGFYVVGVRGLGELNQYDFQRFAYEGEFDRDDFLEGRQVRSWEDEIRGELIGKGLRELEARDLRRSLLAQTSSNELNLDVVPLERTGRYESFSFIFKNLLRLADLGRGDFKELLLDINEGQLGRLELDLRDQYGETYRDIRRERERVEDLREVTEAIDALLGKVERRDQLRASLSAGWERLRERVEATRDEYEDELAQIGVELGERREALEYVDARLEELKEERGDITENIGKLREKLDDLRERRSEFEGFDADAAEERKETLDDRRIELKNRIRSTADANREAIESELREVESELERNVAQLEGLQDRAITWMRDRLGWSDDAIDDLFRLLNPELLTLEVEGEEPDVELRDADALERRIARMRNHLGDEGYEDATLRIDREALDETSASEDYGDTDQLESRIERARKRREELAQTLEDVDERESLREELDDVEADYEEVADRLRRWEEFQDVAERAERENWAGELEDLESEQDEIDGEIERLESRASEIEDEIRELERRQETIRDEIDEIDRRVRSLSPPSEDWPDASDVSDPLDWEADSLDEWFRTYRDRRESHDELVDEIQRDVDSIHRETDDRYAGATLAETLERFREAKEALQEKEDNLERRWESLVNNLSSELKNLRNGLEDLGNEVAKLNRNLNERQISNLQSIRLEVEHRDRIVDRIQQVIEWEENPLFASREGVEDATRFLSDFLEHYGRIELSELFDLTFTIEKVSGETARFDGLQRIESQGTTTTLKVIVHLQLLDMMLLDDEASIPFFLDEISTLDDHNLTAIVEHAREMNFVPVVASPDARACVERIYMLPSPDTESIVLDPEVARHDIHPQTEEADDGR
jgi:chromosome segregation ATPase